MYSPHGLMPAPSNNNRIFGHEIISIRILYSNIILCSNVMLYLTNQSEGGRFGCTQEQNSDLKLGADSKKERLAVGEIYQ